MGICALAAVACSPAGEEGNRIYTLKYSNGIDVSVTYVGGRFTSVVLAD